MRLYYYTAANWGLKSLWEKRLKVSDYKTLNDPFELSPFHLTESAARELSRIIGEVWSNNFGVVCLSENWDSTLMWAHYGDKHSGMCLGFDVPNTNNGLVKIEYTKEKLTCPDDLIGNTTSVSKETLNKHLRYKHDAWKYEQEHRLVVPLQNAVAGTYFHKFNERIFLREVILGARCSLNPADIKDSIEREPLNSVKVFKVQPAHNSFAVCEDSSVPPLLVEGFSDEKKKMSYLVASLRNS